MKMNQRSPAPSHSWPATVGFPFLSPHFSLCSHAEAQSSSLLMGMIYKQTFSDKLRPEGPTRS